ncbi:MAG: branched-chain amino acid aminotransferase [Chitinophagaceae bacterium]
MIEIAKKLSATSRISSVNFANPEFGKDCSDHMFTSVYRNGGWKNPEIVPFGDITFSPAMLALHYGQSVFEGMKAFRMHDGRISIFRPHSNLERFNRSLDRMCMPSIPEDFFFAALIELLRVDQDWVPSAPGTSLYIRPFCFASEPRLKIKIAEQYQFMILMSPAGKYFGNPYRLKVETEYTRTAEGGTGYAKCAGNYGSSFYPVKKALEEGFDQVLWTDAKEHRYIDEAGMMNIMFMVDGKLITPALNSAILEGITRDSVLTIARDKGIEVEERKIAVDELEVFLREGRVSEVFGTGTAAVVAPVKLIRIGEVDYEIQTPDENSFQNKAYTLLNDIRLGLVPDTHGWNFII